MPFQLTVPNYQVAMPKPRVQAPPSPGFGEIAGSALLSSFTNIATEYQKAQDAKASVGALADAMEGIDGQAAAQYRALEKSINPNYLGSLGSKGSGAGSAIKDGVLQDALSIIKAQADFRNREQLLTTGHNQQIERANLGFGQDLAMESFQFSGRKELLGDQLGGYRENANLSHQDRMEELKFEKEGRIERDKEIREFQSELEIAQRKGDLKEFVRERIADGTFRNGVRREGQGMIPASSEIKNDAKDLAELIARGATEEVLIQRIGSAIPQPKFGTQQKSSTGSTGFTIPDDTAIGSALDALAQ